MASVASGQLLLALVFPSLATVQKWWVSSWSLCNVRLESMEFASPKSKMNKLVYREYQEKMSQDHDKLEKEEDINLSFPYILSLSFCLTMHTCWSSVLVCWTWTQTELGNSSICNQNPEWQDPSSDFQSIPALEVLKAKYPEVHHVGDVRKVERMTVTEKVDLVVGGFPCQDLSCMGKREG